MVLKLTVEQLNCGKLLVLEVGHRLTVREIKTLVKANSVKEIRNNYDQSTANYAVHTIISQAIDSVSTANLNSLRIYQVQGNVVSSLIAVRTDKFVYAMDLTGVAVKELHNCIVLLRRIIENKSHITLVSGLHKKLMEEIGLCTKIIKAARTKSKAIDDLDTNYANADIVGLKAHINALLKSSW